ncbi:MAG: hypothetical protein J6Q82_06745 [Clostridia bacterium]|nr:hypothetical protein [Clostridia bacterium]
MTANIKRRTPQGAMLFLAGLFLLVLFFRNAEIAGKAVSSGLLLCVRSLIPSLFPLMVASELLVSSGGVDRLGTFLARPARTILGLRGDAACAVLLGMVCGFPIGTRCALTLYRDGRMSEDEFSRVLALSNHPSPAFLISTVGRSLLGSTRTGILLYLTTICSSLLLGTIFSPRRKRKGISFGEMPSRPAPMIRSFSSSLASAVSASALSLLSICAFVVFFSALVECLTHLSAALSLSKPLTAMIFGFFELTGGVSHAAECSASLARMLCAFSVGWTGLSVHFQLLYLVGDASFSRGKYLLLKLAEGGLNLPILALLLQILP